MYVEKEGFVEKASKLKEGEVEVVVSTTDWDAHGERIMVNGIDFKGYKKNPVILWAHDGFNLPIARAKKLWIEGNKLMARVEFYMNDDFPKKVYQYVLDGFIKAVSIGGMVKEWDEDGATIKELVMKEFSFVSVPANENALVALKSLDKTEKGKLDGLAKTYARKQLSDGNSEGLSKSINELESLVTALKEVAQVEPQEEKVADSTKLRVVLRSAQAVDHQAEEVIKTIKVTLKEKN